MKNNKKPRKKIEKVMRPCMRCGNEFLSEGNHNRLCTFCIRVINKIDRGFDDTPVGHLLPYFSIGDLESRP